MATTQSQPNVSKNDALVVKIVKQLCTSVTGLSNGIEVYKINMTVE